MTHIMHVAPFVCLLQAKQSNIKRTKNKSNKIMLPSIMSNCNDHSNSNSGHQKSCNWYMKSVTLQLLLLFVTVTTFKIKNRLLQRLFSFSSLLFQKMYSLFAFHSFAFRCLPFNQMLHYFTELCCHHKFTMSNKHRSKNWSKNCSGSIFLLNEFQTYLTSKGKEGIDPNLADPIQIRPLYHKYSSVFCEYSESNFPKNFISTSNNFKTSISKSGARKSSK